MSGRCRKVVPVRPNTCTPLAILMAGCALLVGCAAGPARKEDTAANRDPAALTIVAEIALARGDCKTASESYADASQYGAAPLARQASKVALACEHLPAAWKAATRWRALAPAERDASAMYATVAIKLYRISDARSAIIDFSKAQKGADSADLSELAGLLLEQSDAPAVLAAMSSALEPATASPDTDALLAELALDANDSQRATRYAQAALDKDPKQFGAKRVLARAYVMRGDSAKAIATAREVMRDDPTRGAFELAEVFVALDRNDRCILVVSGGYRCPRRRHGGGSCRVPAARRFVVRAGGQSEGGFDSVDP
jgi:tetratricopeptide (TPR) repeat protein